MLTWKKSYDVGALVKQLDSSRVDPEWSHVRPEDSHGVGFSMDVERVLAVVESAIKWPDRIEVHGRSGLLLKAAAEAAQTGHITADNLLTSLNRLVARWRKRRWSEYVVVGSLSMHASTTIISRRLPGAVARFTKSYDPQWDRTPLEEDIAGVLKAGQAPHFKHVSINVHAPDAAVAHHRAIEELDVRRAIWNWTLTHNRWRRNFGRPRPLNPIHWGPVTTVHLPGGKLATRLFAYDHEHHSERRPTQVSKPKELFAAERRLIDRLSRSPIGEDVAGFLLGYVRALDHSSHHETFQALWRVLESMTGGLDANYDTNLRRILACYANVGTTWHTFLAVELKHLRERRNHLVHDGTGLAQMDVLVQQLVSHVHAALSVYCRVLHHLPDLPTAHRFLDLPADETELRQFHGLSRKALKVRYPSTS